MKKVNGRKRRIFLKRVKNVIGVFLVMILIFRVTMVDAGSNDSVIEKNKVDGMYAVTNLNGVNRIFYLNMYTLKGRISYCIEIGVDITSDIYNSTYDFSISNLNKEQINYIKNVSYFGYGYGNHSDIKYYMAAQEIIWEYLNNIEVEWTNVLDFGGERINIDSYKSEIFSLVDSYYKGVKLDNYTDNMEVDIGEEVVISDVNDNIKYYDIVAGEHCNVKVEGNSLYITFNTDYLGNDTIVLKRKDVYDYESSLYYQGDSQKLISNGNIDEKIELNFSIKGKNMSFQLRDNVDIKKNNQFDFLDITFELYYGNGDFICFIKSDELGKMFAENFPYGNYYVRQVRFNKAYHLNYVYQYFTFEDENEVIYLEVEPFINTIKVLKLYGEGDNLKEESGITFDIYNIDGSYYDSFTTGYDGIGIIKVPYGEYIVKQKNSSYGYAKVEDFYVDSRKSSRYPLAYNLVDEVVKSNLIINSKDLDGNLIVENGISYKIKKGDEYLEFDGIDEFESINGVVELPGKIEYGEYVIEIINNSNDYQNDEAEINFVISDNSNFEFVDGEFLLKIDVNFSLIKGMVNVKTYKEKIFYSDNNYYYDYVLNGNVKLDLIANEDIVINGEIVYKNGDKIRDIITDENGEYVIEDIYLGNYCLVDLNGNKKCFEVVDSKSLSVEIKEDLKKGTVIIHNISSDMKDILGTVMEFTDENEQLIYIAATNEEGIIKIDNLMYGEYCFSQKSVDSDYLINEEKVCFSITSDEVVQLEVVNKKAGKKLIMIPNTSSDKKSIKELIVLSLILLGGIIYKFKISNKHS